ncbi:MAG TPA: spore cortex biosynthesis protein YabQ [Peptococcaceae bacterium]|nr:MAG: putative membrane protein [Clostridia bacterium 41_269]HBT20675.1 spore cortex biosynthesis protein YabQ [Peptococcaceae bacterium]
MISVGEQFFYFFTTIITGVMIGILFDIYREVGRVFKNHRTKILYDLFDLLFWLAAAGVSFMFLLFSGYGEVRAYGFLGMGLGLFLYMSHLTKYGKKLIRFILAILLKVLFLLGAVLRIPFIFIQKILFFPQASLA